MAHCLVRPSDRPIQLDHCHKDAVRRHGTARHGLESVAAPVQAGQVRRVRRLTLASKRHIFGLTILAFTLGGSSSDSATGRELRTVANTPYGVGVNAGEWPRITLGSQALCVTGAEPITVDA